MRKRRYPKTGALTFAQARMLQNDVGGRVYDAAVNLFKRGYTIHESALLLDIPSTKQCRIEPFYTTGGAIGVIPTRFDNDLDFHPV